MEPLLIIPFIVSLTTAYFLIPWWIKAAHRIDLVGKDMNKYEKPPVAEMGGIAVVSAFVAGVLAYIGLSTFYFHQSSFLIYLLAALSTVLIITIIGMLDDLLGWKMGLKQWQKPLLTLVAALPMMVVNAGQSDMVLPFIGGVNFGLLYPLLVIPLGITGAANGFNMLAGYNGLEAGMGIIILSTLGIAAFIAKASWVAMLAFIMVFALIAFLRYNWFPARIFPGDTLTYSVGALIACIAILANTEKVAVILFIPYFIDFILPLRKRMKVEAFGKTQKDGSLDAPYDKIYHNTHAAIIFIKKIKGRAYEYDVTLLILITESIIALLTLGWFFG